MSFTGVHVCCHRAGANHKSLPVLSKPLWSETFTTDGITISIAPGRDCRIRVAPAA